MIRTMIPIVHRMGILMRNPTMSRMTACDRLIQVRCDGLIQDHLDDSPAWL